MRIIVELLIIIAVVDLCVSGIKGVRPFMTALIRSVITQKSKADAASALFIRRALFGIIKIALAFLIISYMSFSVDFSSHAYVTIFIEESEQSDTYRKTIERYAEENAIPGMIVGVIDPSGSSLFGYGYNEYTAFRTKTPVDPSTLFEIGSISKAFTGLILAESILEDQLSLDTSVFEILNDHRRIRLSKDPHITLRMLATHTSGLPRMPITAKTFFPIYSIGLTRSNPYKTITDEDIMIVLQRMNVSKPERLTWEYSNLGFGLLGLVLADIHHTTYENMLQECIAKPLGMKNTTTVATMNDHPNMVKGYHLFLRFCSFSIGRHSANWDMHPSMSACGGIRTTGEDMLIFLHALLDNTLSFSKPASMPIHSIDEYAMMGMGWFVHDHAIDGIRLIAHSGQTGGYTGFIGYLQDEKKAVFILSNTAAVQMQPLGIQLLEQMR